MERQQLIKIIDNKGTSTKEETNELWDIVRMFPYFQTARLLLAKSFHDQGSIHFHNELKACAAYATDRKVLSRLMREQTEVRKQPAAQEANVFVPDQKQSQDAYINDSRSENQFVIPEQPPSETPLFEIKQDAPAFTERKAEEVVPETKYREEVKEEKKNVALPPVAASYDEPATINEEIIRRRLSEILSKNKPEESEVIVPEIPIAPSPKIEQLEETIEAKKEVTEPGSSPLDELPAEPVDVIEGLELETIIEENYLIELEKLPEIIPTTPKREENALNEAFATTPFVKSVTTEEISFVDWLKQKNGNETTLEEVTEEETVLEPISHHTISPPLGGRGALIDKFIADRPRIAPPAKAEFYSPANMARLSITDNEDIISETLARIYFDQQNYQKARSCYEKLSLLYPEKSASFAPLIQEIDKILKENQI